MKRSQFVTLLLVALPVGACIVNQMQLDAMNRPWGNFENASEYIAHGRLPVEVRRKVIRGEVFMIAEAPFDIERFSLNSDAAAYVFDESGDLVDWSNDTGDDSAFVNKWWSGKTDVVSVEELRQLGE